MLIWNALQRALTPTWEVTGLWGWSLHRGHFLQTFELSHDRLGGRQNSESRRQDGLAGGLYKAVVFLLRKPKGRDEVPRDTEWGRGKKR